MFPNVRIREFKAVGGKCDVCAKLSELRKCARNKIGKQQLTSLHLLHRSAYMGERMSYSIRRQDAITLDTQFLSMITDGMAQTHCEMANISNFGNKLKQHLQGVLVHGKGMFVFRTFHTIKNGSNLQIHSMLLTLENLKLVTMVDEFEKFMKDIKNYYEKTQPKVVKDWEEFQKLVPDTNSAEEYVEK
jgi:hypothetical protein